MHVAQALNERFRADIGIRSRKQKHPLYYFLSAVVNTATMFAVPSTPWVEMLARLTSVLESNPLQWQGLSTQRPRLHSSQGPNIIL